MQSVEKPAVFHDTTHADRRRTERALTIEQLKSVVLNHDRKTQHRRGEHGGFVYEFTKRIQGRNLVVIAELKKHECWLITGWREEDEE